MRISTSSLIHAIENLPNVNEHPEDVYYVKVLEPFDPNSSERPSYARFIILSFNKNLERNGWNLDFAENAFPTEID